MRTAGLALAMSIAVAPFSGWAASGGQLAVPASVAHDCPGSGRVEHLDIPYRRLSGIDQGLLSLDLYQPVLDEGCPPAPVMVWVHGGGWITGDKGNKLDAKVDLFNGMGWILVSVNYRLSPAEIPADVSDLDPERITYPVHEEDVAAAVAWVYQHAADYGGDPGRISLMGHSAGAAIVATLATDASFFRAHGLDLGVLRHAIALDTAAYDLRWRIETATPAGVMLYLNAFGTDPALWDLASPIRHVAPGRCIPPFFVVTRGSLGRVAATKRFGEVLRAAGVPVTLLYTPEYDHAGVNEAIGDPRDTSITPRLEAFLDTAFPSRATCIDHSARVRRHSARALPAR